MNPRLAWREDAAIRAAYWLMAAIAVFILLAFFFAPRTAHAEDADQWTATDTALQVTYSVLHVMDWSQTLHIARNPDRYSEADPLVRAFIGRNPSEGKVNAFVGSALVLQTYIAYCLPRRAEVFGLEVPARTLWQSIWIGIEGFTVQRNRRLGIGISLHF